MTVDSSVKVPGDFLAVLGRPPRESACECERSNAIQLGPVLSFVSGPVVNNPLKDPNNRIAKIVVAEKDDVKVVEQLFLAILNRRPTAKEIEIGVEALLGNDEEFDRQLVLSKKHAAALAAYEKGFPKNVAQFEKSAVRMPVWTPLEAVTLKSQGGAELKSQPDGSILVTGMTPQTDTYAITFDTKLTDITGLRLEVLPDDSLPAKGPGRAANGNFVLNEFKIEYVKMGDDGKPAAIKLIRPQATFSQDTFPIGNAIDNNPKTGWAISPQFGKPQTAVFEFEKKVAASEGITLTVTMQQNFGTQHNVGKFRISLTNSKTPIQLKMAYPDNVTKALQIPAAERTPEQQTAIVNYVRSIDQELAKLQRAVSEHPFPGSPRLLGAQDLAWALINSPAFLFNR
jgi:hypothetical protein